MRAGSDLTIPDLTRSDRAGWMSWDEAIAYTRFSESTLKRAVSSGKISKTTVPVPGRSQPERYLWKADLDKLLAPVHCTGHA